MTPPLLFTHIPKTAGTSLKASVIYPNVAREHLYVVRGVGKLIRDRPQHAEVIMGHIPYGVHRALPQPEVRYLTILRDPVDRCVSFYNYVLMCGTRNPGHLGTVVGHPALADAERLAIDEFYTVERYRNIQTKFTAGVVWERARAVLPPVVSGVVAAESRMLRRAMRNLEDAYWFFGLLEQIEDAQERIARSLGWTNAEVRDRSRQTSGSAARVVPTPEQRARIQAANRLDIELYAFARARYEAQTVGRS